MIDPDKFVNFLSLLMGSVCIGYGLDSGMVGLGVFFIGFAFLPSW